MSEEEEATAGLLSLNQSTFSKKRGRKQRGGQAAAKGGAKAPDENAEGQDVKLGDDDGAGGASGAAATGASGGEAVEGGNVDENGGAGNGDGPPVSALANAMGGGGGGGGGGEMEDMDVGPDQDDDDPDEKPAGRGKRSRGGMPKGTTGKGWCIIGTTKSCTGQASYVVAGVNPATLKAYTRSDGGACHYCAKTDVRFSTDGVLDRKKCRPTRRPWCKMANCSKEACLVDERTGILSVCTQHGSDEEWRRLPYHRRLDDFACTHLQPLVIHVNSHSGVYSVDLGVGQVVETMGRDVFAQVLVGHHVLTTGTSDGKKHWARVEEVDPGAGVLRVVATCSAQAFYRDLMAPAWWCREHSREQPNAVPMRNPKRTRDADWNSTYAHYVRVYGEQNFPIAPWRALVRGVGRLDPSKASAVGPPLAPPPPPPAPFIPPALPPPVPYQPPRVSAYIEPPAPGEAPSTPAAPVTTTTSMELALDEVPRPAPQVPAPAAPTPSDMMLPAHPPPPFASALARPLDVGATLTSPALSHSFVLTRKLALTAEHADLFEAETLLHVPPQGGPATEGTGMGGERLIFWISREPGQWAQNTWQREKKVLEILDASPRCPYVASARPELHFMDEATGRYVIALDRPGESLDQTQPAFSLSTLRHWGLCLARALAHLHDRHLLCASLCPASLSTANQDAVLTPLSPALRLDPCTRLPLPQDALCLRHVDSLATAPELRHAFARTRDALAACTALGARSATGPTGPTNPDRLRIESTLTEALAEAGATPRADLWSWGVCMLSLLDNQDGGAGNEEVEHMARRTFAERRAWVLRKMRDRWGEEEERGGRRLATAIARSLCLSVADRCDAGEVCDMLGGAEALAGRVLRAASGDRGYVLDKVVAEEESSTLWEARVEGTGERVLLKASCEALREEETRDERRRGMLADWEAQVQAGRAMDGLACRSVGPRQGEAFVDVGGKGWACVVMHIPPGTSLATLLRPSPPSYTLTDVLRWARQLTTGLQTLLHHSTLPSPSTLHPEHVHMSGSGDAIILTLARLSDAPGLYTPPEARLLHPPPLSASDTVMWGLGVCLYLLATRAAADEQAIGDLSRRGDTPAVVEDLIRRQWNGTEAEEGVRALAEVIGQTMAGRGLQFGQAQERWTPDMVLQRLRQADKRSPEDIMASYRARFLHLHPPSPCLPVSLCPSPTLPPTTPPEHVALLSGLVAILGPIGSGKTTLAHNLATHLLATRELPVLVSAGDLLRATSPASAQTIPTALLPLALSDAALADDLATLQETAAVTPPTLLVDGWEALDSTAASTLLLSLTSLLPSFPRILLFARPSPTLPPLPPATTTLHLRAPCPSTSRLLLQTACPHLPPSLTSHLTSLFHGSPLLLTLSARLPSPLSDAALLDALLPSLLPLEPPLLCLPSLVAYLLYHNLDPSSPTASLPALHAALHTTLPHLSPTMLPSLLRRLRPLLTVTPDSRYALLHPTLHVHLASRHLLTPPTEVLTHLQQLLPSSPHSPPPVLPPAFDWASLQHLESAPMHGVYRHCGRQQGVRWLLDRMLRDDTPSPPLDTKRARRWHTQTPDDWLHSLQQGGQDVEDPHLHRLSIALDACTLPTDPQQAADCEALSHTLADALHAVLQHHPSTAHGLLHRLAGATDGWAHFPPSGTQHLLRLTCTYVTSPTATPPSKAACSLLLSTLLPAALSLPELMAWQPNETLALVSSTLLALLSDGDAQVRSAAAAAVGRMGPTLMPPELPDALLARAFDPDAAVRRGLVEALGHWGAQTLGQGDTRAPACLLQLLGDPEVSVTRACLSSLAHWPHSPPQPLLERLGDMDPLANPEVEPQARALLLAVARGGGADAAASGLLSHSSPGVRRVAVATLGLCPSSPIQPAAMQALMIALRDDSAAVRCEALRALQSWTRMGHVQQDRHVLAALVQATKDADAGAREAAEGVMRQLFTHVSGSGGSEVMVTLMGLMMDDRR